MDALRTGRALGSRVDPDVRPAARLAELSCRCGRCVRGVRDRHDVAGTGFGRWAAWPTLSH